MDQEVGGSIPPASTNLSFAADVSSGSAPIIDDIGEAEIRALLAQRANFVRVVRVREAGGFRLLSVSPPNDVTRSVAALGEWELPPLEAVTESPVLRADGSILSRVGYDEATKLFYHRGPELSVPDIPDSPERQDAQAALTQGLEPIAEFPFADGASKANAMAAMLTPVVRMAVDGNVPIALLDAPQMGSGKSLLSTMSTRCISLAASRPRGGKTTEQSKNGKPGAGGAGADPIGGARMAAARRFTYRVLRQTLLTLR